MSPYEEPKLSISCRSVGPGGTSIAFYPRGNGVQAVWTNENCPYDEADDRNAAFNGSNVSTISWEELEELMKHRPAPGKKARR